MDWQQVGLKSREFTCGYCGYVVATGDGFRNSREPHRRAYVCPHCEQPTYFDNETQIPAPAPGSEVAHLPADIEALYREARNCVTVAANTASVLACRKLLMNIAVSQGAPENKRFIEYVQYLADKGFVPPNGTGWVDHIRTKGNEATHEIALMTTADAEDLITFSEMLLKFIYEFPKRVPAKTKS